MCHSLITIQYLKKEPLQYFAKYARNIKFVSPIEAKQTIEYNQAMKKCEEQILAIKT